MKRTKRQHYVTRAYLDGFLGDGQRTFWVYGRNRDAAFRANPESVAFEGNYYSFKRPDGTWDDELETFLANHVEGPGIGFVRRLTKHETELSWQEREHLALALAFQEFRVPSMREVHDTMFQQAMEHLQADFETHESANLRLRFFSRFHDLTSEVSVTPESIKAELQKIADDPTRFSRESMQHHAFSFMRIYRYMRWEVYYAGGKEQFVTSDCPVMRVFPPGGDTSMSLLRPDVEVRFPLDKRSMLILRHDRDATQRVKEAGSEASRVFDDFERSVPQAVIHRRFGRSIRNFIMDYRVLADSWYLFDNTGTRPELIAVEKAKKLRIMKPDVYRALAARYGEK